MQTTFLIEIGFWVKNVEIRYYKNHMSKNKIEIIKCTTLWSFETYDEIVVRLTAIKFKKNSFCYLPSIHLSLAIQAFIFL